MSVSPDKGFKAPLPITPSMAEVQSEVPQLDDSNKVYANQILPAYSDRIMTGAMNKANDENQDRLRILSEAKHEVSIILALSIEIDKETPLIYDEEHVLPQLHNIEQFFDSLIDNLSEVRDYMITLLEYIEEEKNEDIMLKLKPPLIRVIYLLKQVCPASESVTPGIASKDDYATMTPYN